VDEVLGLKPLPGEKYIPVRSGEKDYWDSRLNYLKVSRKSFWNDDYLQFLVEKVWKIDKPVQILDCGCGFGYMGQMLLPHLPEGSGYTGGAFLPAGKLFQNEKGHFRGRQGALFPGRVPKKHTFWRSCGNVYLLSNTNI